MNKVLLATLSIGALTLGAANAADIPVKAPRAVGPAFTCAAGQFGGWHIGIHGGSVYHQAHRADIDGNVTGDPIGLTINKWGGHAGGQIGYDWTTCSTVWGVEVDGSWVFGTKQHVVLDDPTEFLETRTDWLATARVRGGLALDNVLLYTTGGVAAARFRTIWQDNPTTISSFKETRFGWVAGVGSEWAWSPNISFKFETLYVGFTDRERLAANGDRFRHSDSMWVSRIGLNYRWGAPVVARY